VDLISFARVNINVYSRDLSVPSDSLSLSVRVLRRELQVAGTEQLNLCLANAVLANGLDNWVVMAEHRVCTLSHSLMWWLRYAGIDVVRTLYVSTTYLYLIRCWTGSQCSWRSSGLVWDHLGAWRTICATLFWTCCGFMDVAGWNPAEHSVAVVKPWQYQTTGKRLCKLSCQQMANVAEGLFVVIAWSHNCWSVLLESQVSI